jgi:hypothetical protein
MDGKRLYETMLSKMPPSMNAKPPVSAWCLDTALEATPVGARAAPRRRGRGRPRQGLSSATGAICAMLCARAGRAIKEKLEPEQLAAIKEIKGIPMVDK